jgi:hypothetical protein
MAHLSSLSFTTAPQKSYDPKQVRRQKLIERLEEQKRLVADPTFIPVVKRWKKNPDGSKSIFDHYRRLKPWWTVDAAGTVILTIRAGLKVLEFEKGKTGILVGPVEDLGEVLDILIAATMAGELDLLLASATDIEERAVPKTKKRSKSRSNF